MCKAFVLFVKETLLQINSLVSGALSFSAWFSLRVDSLSERVFHGLLVILFWCSSFTHNCCNNS